MKLLKSLAVDALFRTEAYKLQRLKNKCYILPYHMIVDKPCGFYPEMASIVFKKQMEYISSNYRVLPLQELADRLREGKSLRRCLSITFDDGFKDNYLNAYPILKRLGLPATIFLTTGYLDSGEAPWFINFRRMFMETEQKHLNIRLGSTNLNMPITNNIEKIKASDSAMASVKACSNNERLDLIEILRLSLKSSDSPASHQGLMLGWDNVREMAGNGINFGAHTVNHPVLSRVDLNTAEEEITVSKRRIEEELVEQVTTFAYPFGRKDQYKKELFPILRRLGFSCAVTTEHGSNNHNANPFELKRNRPWELSHQKWEQYLD